MTSFWKSDVYAVVKAMKASGNQRGIIQRWKDDMEVWAMRNPGPDADAVNAWLPYWQTRPFYTASELAPIFPMIAVAIGHKSSLVKARSPARLAHELQFAGLPILGKYYHPMRRREETFFVVERLHYWKVRDLSQSEFEQEFLHVFG